MLQCVGQVQLQHDFVFGYSGVPEGLWVLYLMGCLELCGGGW
jgi:hypothetical protein